MSQRKGRINGLPEGVLVLRPGCARLTWEETVSTPARLDDLFSLGIQMMDGKKLVNVFTGKKVASGYVEAVIPTAELGRITLEIKVRLASGWERHAERR